MGGVGVMRGKEGRGGRGGGRLGGWAAADGSSSLAK